jgi:hypothetical protein
MGSVANPPRVIAATTPSEAVQEQRKNTMNTTDTLKRVIAARPVIGVDG